MQILYYTFLRARIFPHAMLIYVENYFAKANNQNKTPPFTTAHKKNPAPAGFL